MWNWFYRTATLKTKLLIILPILLIIGLVLLWGFRDTSLVPEDDNTYKILQGENNQLRQQNADLRKQYESAIVKGEALEMERDGLRVDLEKFGKQAVAGVQKQKEAAEQYEKEMVIIGVDTDPVVRCNRYCTNRSELGYPCRPSTQAYCQRYSTGQ